MFELSDEMAKRFMRMYGLLQYDTKVLVTQSRLLTSRSSRVNTLSRTNASEFLTCIIAFHPNALASASEILKADHLVFSTMESRAKNRETRSGA